MGIHGGEDLCDVVCCDGLSDRHPEGQPGLADWEAVDERTEIQGKPSFLVHREELKKSNIPEEPAQIINTSYYLLIVLNNENVLLCVLIAYNSRNLITSGVLIVDYRHLIYNLKRAIPCCLWNIYCSHVRA